MLSKLFLLSAAVEGNVNAKISVNTKVEVNAGTTNGMQGKSSLWEASVHVTISGMVPTGTLSVYMLKRNPTRRRHCRPNIRSVFHPLREAPLR